MTSITHSPLLTASASTFESLALLFADETPSDAQRAAPLARGVRVTFAGPLDGSLTLRVTEDVARALAANMLGLDPAAAGDARVLQDALGEVANVICGNLLPEIAGRRAVFHLGAPGPVPPSPGADDPDADAVPPAVHVTLGVDEGRADVALVVRPARATTPDETAPPPRPPSHAAP
jgi:CheY-specific phosphatase CheX